MAMNAGTLKAALIADFIAKLKPYFDNPPDDERLSGYDFSVMWGIISEVIAETIIGHIQANARCQGIDSHGDSHDSVQIV